MEFRKYQEELEESVLAPQACKSANTKGRERFEAPCDIRAEFQRDRDRIIHCKAFRRLKHKTQVFIAPEGDHYRTRLTHTLEVAQIARTISRALRLNEDLTEAIALGHDLGHTPFGHAGERALDKLCSSGFEHNKQSLRIVERLEKGGKGLNLTWEVKDGILNHRTECNPSTMEGQVVRLSDKIAYINHDIDDAIRAGMLTNENIPASIRNIVGDSPSKRINAMIRDTVESSMGHLEIRMSDTMGILTTQLRRFMFAHVYSSPEAEVEHKKAEKIIEFLYLHFMKYPEQMSSEFVALLLQEEKKEQVVCDYIACMTDPFAIKVFTSIYIPKSWSIS